ncbi:LOW QUALITY PROTEIN: hypothetical protein Cgig2_003416 [Carnegiea gigantea]|uniref:Uncharacterized protein n=1 Tax=Carnegiea gigantea TaxID=171969 RepID=A0A9Q1KAA2_9CARY|nr:LOW QUALITY PROTEIN: hypothetical protein Cgig2_003416 [Carnegiea gigantea]
MLGKHRSIQRSCLPEKARSMYMSLLGNSNAPTRYLENLAHCPRLLMVRKDRNQNGDEVDMARHIAPRKGVTMASTSSVGNMKVGTGAGTEGLGNEATIELGMQSVDHGLSMAVESTTVDGADADEAYVDPPLGLPVTNPNGDTQRTPESERTTSHDTKDVPCERDGVGKSSNILTCMKRRPQCRKPIAVHGTPYTDPTRMPGARKTQKDMTEGITGAETAYAGSDPCDGTADEEVLDVQAITVEGSCMGLSAEDLNNLKLTKQVLTGYITMPLLATELELPNNVRSSDVLLRLTAAFTLWGREEDLKECIPKLVSASWLRGLINVVLKARAGDRYRRFCIGNLAMDMFTELLHRRQHTYPKLCYMSVFLKHLTSDSFKPAPQADLRYVRYKNCYKWEHIDGLFMNMLTNVFMPLLETTKVDKNRQALVDNAVGRNYYLWLEFHFCVFFEPSLMGCELHY